MKYKTVIEYGGRNFFHKAICKSLIEVQQRGPDKFRVIYGLQVREGLNYAQAAKEFGECVFHLESCNDKVDNKDPLGG